jgi:hypothetical protein
VAWNKQTVFTFFGGGRNTNVMYRWALSYVRGSYMRLRELEFINSVVHNSEKLMIFLNVQALAEDKNDDLLDDFYEELKCMCEQFKYHVSLLGDFGAKA